MADSIAKILADLTSSINAGESLTSSLKAISEAQKGANESASEFKDQLELIKKSTEKLAKSQEKLAKAKKKHDKIGNKSHEEKIASQEKIARLSKVEAKDKEKSLLLSEAVYKSLVREKLVRDKINTIAKENWKQNTRMGQAFNAASKSVSKFAAGITTAALASKAAGKWFESVNLTQELMTKSFKGFDGAKGWIETGSAVLETNKALTSARAAAILFGQDVEAVGGYMIQFQRIAGTENPKALGAMTKATMGAARAVGVDMPTAMAFVKDRIDKYGGSVSSAIIAMEGMRLEAKHINNTFGGSKIRIDDVINSVNQITSSSNIYAIDQDFVTKAIMRNMISLQNQGESYDFAKDRAMGYMKSLTSEAPEFMKIMSGKKLFSGMAEAFSGKDAVANFEEKFGKDLDRAKPGLSKQIQDILGGPGSAFTKGQLIQDLTAGLEIGVNTMRDQMLGMVENAKDPLQVIKSMYKVNEVEARSMLMQAQESKKLEMDKAAISKENISLEEASLIIEKDGFKLTEKEFERGKSVKGGMAILLQQKRDSLAADILATEEAKKKVDTDKASADLVELEGKRKEAIRKLDEEGLSEDKYKKELESLNAFYDVRKNELDKFVTRSVKKGGEKDISELEKTSDMYKGLLEKFNALNLNTIKSTLEEFSGIMNISGLTILYYAFGNRLKKIFSVAADKFATNMSGGGGDFGGGGKDGKKKVKYRRGATSSISRGKFSTLKKSGKFGKLLNLGGKFARGASKFGGGIVDVAKGAGSKLLSVGGKGLAKGGKFLAKGAGKLLGPLAGLADLAINLQSGEGIGRSLFKAAGSTIGGALGGIGGTMLMPGVGTFAGGVAGGTGGDWIGGKIADMFGFTDPNAMAKGVNSAKKLQGATESTPEASQAVLPVGTQTTASTTGSGVIAPSGQIIGQDLLLKIDGGMMAQMMSMLQNKQIT